VVVVRGWNVVVAPVGTGPVVGWVIVDSVRWGGRCGDLISGGCGGGQEVLAGRRLAGYGNVGGLSTDFYFYG